MKSEAHSGIAYLTTVISLIIAAFNYYIAVAKELSFKAKFKEMSTISLSMAFVSFLIGVAVKQFLGIGGIVINNHIQHYSSNSSQYYLNLIKWIRIRSLS